MSQVKYLLIGGGPTSVFAAQNIRERDADGTICIINGEKWMPYDKPPISKQYLQKDGYVPDDATSKFDNFYPDNQIELRNGVKATKIDREAKSVELSDGTSIGYEKLLIATGASPRTLDVPGSTLGGIYPLRSIDDAEAVQHAMQHGRSAVMVGGGFIGMEAAAAAVGRGLVTTVIDGADHPWSSFASPKLGSFLQTYYEGKGVQFVMEEEVSSFTGNRQIQAVNTRGGSTVEADLAVVGIGVVLNTRIAREAGLELSPRGGIVVDEYLRTSDPSVYAAGDVAHFLDLTAGKHWHVEHHLNAKWQGRAVGAIMAGEEKPYDQVAYFYSDVFDIHMILRGEARGGVSTSIFGDLYAGEFVELYATPDGTLKSGVAISHDEPKLDPISDKLEELIRAKANVRDIEAAHFGL